MDFPFAFSLVEVGRGNAFGAAFQTERTAFAGLAGLAEGDRRFVVEGDLAGEVLVHLKP
jgi:hypothetical protein